MPPPSPRSDEKAPAEHGARAGTGAAARGPGGAPPARGTGDAPGTRDAPGTEHGVPVLPAPHSARPERGPAAPPMPLSRFNAVPDEAAAALLRRCCGSTRWADRIAGCRPYPDTGSLLAAVDEASYDMTHGDLAEALAAETPHLFFPGAEPGQAAGRGGRMHRDPRGLLTAHTALRAAHTAYEHRFGHTFLVCLDGWEPEEQLGQALASVRARLGNDEEEERLVVTEELRRLAGVRLRRTVAGLAGTA